MTGTNKSNKKMSSSKHLSMDLRPMMSGLNSIENSVSSTSNPSSFREAAGKLIVKDRKQSVIPPKPGVLMTTLRAKSLFHSHKRFSS